MACVCIKVKDLTLHLVVAISKICSITKPETKVTYLADSTSKRLLDSNNNRLVIYE